MDANHDSDLNRLERRLASWRPADDKLDADAVLFAAGRATAPSASRAWKVAAGLLAVAAVGLGTWAGLERSARLELVQRLEERPAPLAPPEYPSPVEPPSGESYLTARQLVLERGPDSWSSEPGVNGTVSLPDSSDVSTLRAWRRDWRIVP